MEEYILEYLFQQVEEDLIKGNDYAVLIFLLRTSYENCWQDKLKVKVNKATEDLGFTNPTFYSSLDRLEFAGLIEFETVSGRKGYTLVTINFIEDLLNSRHFNEESSKHEEKVLNEHAPKTKKMMETRIIRASRDKDSVDFKYKKSLQLAPLKYKDSLHLRVENIKKFYNKFLLNIKKFYNLDAKYKKSLHFSPPKYKVSLHFMSSAKSLSISDLTNVSTQRYRNIRSFFARNGTIYSKSYINIINTIDKVLFDGNLFDAIEHYTIEEKSKKGSSKYSSKEFQLNEETIQKHVPLELIEHSETILGEEISFIESYQNWLDYKKNDCGNPVGYNSALKNIKWLASLPNPVESIETSIRKEANGIFKVESNYQKFNKKSSENNGKTNVGNVRRFD